MTRPPRDERGAVVIVTALGMITVLLLAAIVIDLGSTRSIRGNARATADAAAAAGAFDLGTSGSAPACAAAFSYAFANLGGTQPNAGNITSACATAGMAGTCTTGGPARVAALTAGGTTVRVTNPVPDSSALLRATAVGGGVAQPANATTDGTDCQRLGVQITQPQSSFFSGVATSAATTFTVHSVARYQPEIRGLLIPPALVLLNQRTCKAVDTGSGKVLVERTPLGPGLVYSDSDGTNPACSGSSGILHTSGSGALRAAASSPTSPGELAWYTAPASRGYASGQSRLENGSTTDHAAYVGRLYARDTRVTRVPADQAYHCTNVLVTPAQPLCTDVDPVNEADALAQATTAPAGFTTWTGPCTTSGSTITFTGKVFVNCPTTFEVKGNPLRVAGGATVVFRGRLDVAANGILAVNVSSPASPAVGSDGLPLPVSPAQSRLIVGSTAANAVDINSNSAAIAMAETLVYSRGGFRLQALNKLLWSPPSAGPSKGLLYWSESSQPLTIQGGPALKAAGVMFHGNGPLLGGGGGTIDLTHVQMWVDRIVLSGSTTVKLSPDPENSIRLAGAGSTLIR